MTIDSVIPNANNVNFSAWQSALPLAGTQTVAPSENYASPTSFASTLRSRTISSGSVDLDTVFDAAGQKYNISPNLLKAVAKVESNFRADVTSKVGAMGIMQLMPGTAKYLGVDDPYNAEQSIMGGAKYLREQLDRFDGDVELALAAYNAGWPAVIKHGGIPPFRETQAYVPKVLSYMGGGEITAGMLTYDGFDMAGRISETSTKSSSFNFNEALAQMLFIKLIEMQMSTSGDSKNTVL
ncbi:MAG: lytic transglycosylase domain-containing protein [Oscillospiraceae bacterium]|nr:lytic transglycosylase domain-containing protein [Oscillospiraceae bacterium]